VDERDGRRRDEMGVDPEGGGVGGATSCDDDKEASPSSNDGALEMVVPAAAFFPGPFLPCPPFSTQ